jgi:hypothetical protein
LSILPVSYIKLKKNHINYSPNIKPYQYSTKKPPFNNGGLKSHYGMLKNGSHAELVSASHRTGIPSEVYLANGVPKQVRHDIGDKIVCHSTFRIL